MYILAVKVGRDYRPTASEEGGSWSAAGQSSACAEGAWVWRRRSADTRPLGAWEAGPRRGLGRPGVVDGGRASSARWWSISPWVLRLSHSLAPSGSAQVMPGRGYARRVITWSQVPSPHFARG